jgi:DNA-binding transcriptional ArsR family regulator
MSRLSKEEIVGLKAVAKKNEGKMSKCAIGSLFGVTEGTVRYHLRRDEEGAVDRRKDKPMKAIPYAHIIAQWMEDSKEDNPPPSVEDLYEYLIENYAYEGSYRSVLRYVRKNYPPPKTRRAKKG